MGLKEKTKTRFRERNEEATRGILEQGERLVASGPADTASPWLGLIGIVPGLIIMFLTNKHYMVSLTDRRLLLVEASVAWRSKGSVLAYSLAGVSVVKFRQAAFGPVLRIQVPGGTVMRLGFNRLWRAESGVIANAIKGVLPPTDVRA